MKNPNKLKLLASSCHSRRLLVAAAVTTLFVPAQAGQMDVEIGTQMYRDFAENRGIFAPGATVDTTINGKRLYIEKMTNFDNTIDRGSGALIGSPQFVLSVAHDTASTTKYDITFAQRFGAVQGTPFYDSYKDVGSTVGYTSRKNVTVNGGIRYPHVDDIRITRLNKVVTEAEAAPYLTDDSIASNIHKYQLLRVGGGPLFLRDYSTNPNTVTQVGASSRHLTGGTVHINKRQISDPADIDSRPAAETKGYVYTSYARNVNGFYGHDDTPLKIPIHAGDSGSPLYVYNPKTAQWEFAGVNSNREFDGNAANNITQGSVWSHNPGFITKALESYVSPTIKEVTSGGNILWHTPNGSGAGTLTQGGKSWDYQGLPESRRGATSTKSANGSTTAASYDMMGATKDLVFAGGGGTIVLQGSIDMGAGSLTFGENNPPAGRGDVSYTLTNGGAISRRLNSAGMIINAGVTVTTELTGIAGDEWRKIGNGTLVVAGSGANAADLNIGGGGVVVLNRSGGPAARNVKINGGGATVRLLGANQISGDVIFGHRGGVLDLHGNNFTDNAITHLDSGATIANLKQNTVSTFTFTGPGKESFVGSFSDGGVSSTSKLNVVYNPANAANAVWTLPGVNYNMGTWDIRGGKVVVQGVLTPHAGNFKDYNDWQTAVFDTGRVSVGSGAAFVVNEHAKVASNVLIQTGGRFEIVKGGEHTGTMTLGGGDATFQLDVEADREIVTRPGWISGTGVVHKSGTGRFVLGGGNTFAGKLVISGGELRMGATGVLNENNSVEVLEGGMLDLNGYSISTGNVLGSGTITNGGATASTLTVNETSTATLGVSLASSGANLNLVKTGTGTLTLSGNSTRTGDTRIEGGTLRMGNASALNATGSVEVRSGGVLDLNGHDVSTGNVSGAGTITNRGSTAGTLTINQTEGTFILPQLTSSGAALNLVKRGSGTLVLERGNSQTGTVTVSEGTLQVGNNSTGGNLGSASLVTIEADAKLAFARSNAYTYSTVIEGAGALVKKSAGSLTLRGNNTYTGGTRIEAGTLIVGNASALGKGSVEVLQGAFLDLKGHSVALTGASGAGGITNSGSTASTLTIDEAGTSILARLVKSGSNANLNLVKTGAGTLTLSGNNTHTGDVRIEGGTLRMGNANALGATGSVEVLEGSLDLNGYSISAGNVSGAGTVTNSGGTVSTLTINQTENSVILPQLTSSGAALNLVKQGSGTLVLTRGNSQKGTITIDGGILQVGDNSTGGNLGTTDTVTVKQGSTLVFARANDTTASNVITGEGSLVKQSAGTLTLNGKSSYTGQTLISQGTLKLSNTGTIYQSREIYIAAPDAIFDVSSYTAGYSLESGQLLKGFGKVKGNLNVRGKINPGNTVGTLNVEGNVTLKAGARLILEIHGSDVGDFDRIAFIGSNRKLTFDTGAGLEVKNMMGGSSLEGTYQVINNATVVGFVGFSEGAYHFDLSTTGLLTITALNMPAGLSSYGLGSDWGVSAVPEPGTYALGGGVVLLGLLVLRRRVR